MMRSMYSGVAGLKTHQMRMDVIGNNIANVNTVGYKAQAALFSELLYQNSSNATGPNANTNTGGINAKQVGLGVKMASISTNITLPGWAETTNNPFDLRITGDSFFIVTDGRNNLFTRDGSFKVDAAGNLVMSSNGYKVLGWQVDPDTNDIKPDTVSALQIMNAANMTYPAEATTQAYVTGIVDAESPEVNSPDGKIMNLNFYDSRGYSYTAKLALKRVDGNNENVNSYSCELTKLLDASGKDVTATAGISMGSSNVTMPDEKKTLANGYSLSGTGPQYTLDYVVDGITGEHIVYTINDSNDGNCVTAIKYPAGGTQNGEAMTNDEAWAGVAKAFGYTNVDDFKRMRSSITTGTAPNTTTTTYNVSTQLGSLMQANGMKEDNGNPAEGAKAGEIIFNGKTINGCSIDFSKADGSFVGISNVAGAKTTQITFANTPDASNFETITVDFSTLNNSGNEKVTTANATNGSLAGDKIGAGRKIGKMSGLSIQDDGKIYATYDNGQSKLLGQIAVASFANASGLQKEGDNLYSATQNSGDFDGIGIDIKSDGGYMTTGELEMSNVDLSGELTGMIVTQRGFQANSRIITVSDTMLEELINLKR